ncbi:hypothetical protein CQA70_29180 [Klebsiella pneumoniae]|nr:hypothetical protein CQA70_29180 [Klebsiella pneumoniae]
MSLPEQAMIFGDRDRLMPALQQSAWRTACAIPTAAASLHIAARRSGRTAWMIDLRRQRPRRQR